MIERWKDPIIMGEVVHCNLLLGSEAIQCYYNGHAEAVDWLP